MDEALIRHLVAERIPVNDIRKLEAVRKGDLHVHRREQRLYATFDLDGFRLLAVV